jgi:hypothetical protein
MATADFGNFSSSTAALLQQDGKIVVAGYYVPGIGNRFALARFNAELNVGTLAPAVSKNTLSVFPNPVQQEIVVSYTLTHTDEISVQLVDEAGRLIRELIRKTSRAAGSHREVVELPAGLADGVYVVVLLSGEEKVAVKVVR